MQIILVIELTIINIKTRLGPAPDVLLQDNHLQMIIPLAFTNFIKEPDKKRNNSTNNVL